MFKPRFTLLFVFVGLLAGCDCLPADWSQWLPGATSTVGDVSPDNPLDPNTPALDSPAAVSEPIRLRLSNPTEYDADCRITMELIGHEVHFSLRRILTTTESLVIGPDKADIIRVEVTFLTKPPIVPDAQVLRIGKDFSPGDIVDIVLQLPPDDSTQDLPPDDQGEDEPPPPPPPATGACCLLTGDCIVTTADDCSSEYGGEYQGDDSTCDPNPCPQPTGACCLVDGTCTVTTADECSYEYEGDYQGDETSCDPNPCPPPTGACCLWDGYCEVMTAHECYSHEARYLGHGTTCDPNPCVGACCFSDGTCAVLTDWDCYYQTGDYQGSGTTCEPNPCPQPATGACCFEDGYCEVMTEGDCNIFQGSYWGDDTPCDPNNPCPQPPPTGACCLWGGTCYITDSPACSYSDGVYQGDGTSCDPNPCTPSPGNTCEVPLIVQLPLELPYQHADFTCARVNDYSETCLALFDEGEDFICRLEVSEPVLVNITLDPLGLPGTGIALDSICPPAGECMAVRNDESGALYGIYEQALEPGTYYLMVDTQEEVGCIGFGLMIDGY